MLDIKSIITNPNLVKKDLRKRQDKEKVPWVDEVVEKFTQWKKLKEGNDKLRHGRNIITREINELRKQGKSIDAKVKQAKKLPAKIDEAEKKLDYLQNRIDFIMQRLPNILHDSVPAGKDEKDNKEIRRWGKSKKAEGLKIHGELLEQRDLADFHRATKISGAGFYFLKGDLVRLEHALIHFALDFLTDKGFTPITPPLLLRTIPYEGVIEMEAFENMMYKIDQEDAHLIATSEHPIAAMYMNDILEEKDLPIKYAGLSMCFRKEIGSHGVDTRGLFRVHQFNKIEQFIFSKPEDSWKLHEVLLKNAEDLIKKLKLPYRVVNICTADIGSVAAKKYDIEGWFPRQNKYQELTSCSNCTNYQAISLNIRYQNSKGEKQHVHTLNSTAIATGRVMAAIAENFQNKDGSITVPKVLVKYLGKDVI